MNFEVEELGIIRRLDELGRVVIPAEIRNLLELKSQDLINCIFYFDKNNPDNLIIRMNKFKKPSKI